MMVNNPSTNNPLQSRRDEYKKSLNRKHIDYSNAIMELQDLQEKEECQQQTFILYPISKQSSKQSEMGLKNSSKQSPNQYFNQSESYVNEYYRAFKQGEEKFLNQIINQQYSVGSSEILLDSSQISAVHVGEVSLISGKMSCISVSSVLSSKNDREPIETTKTPSSAAVNQVVQNQNQISYYQKSVCFLTQLVILTFAIILAQLISSFLIVN